jgi:mannose-1-phosphate guanylyltransferase
MSDALHVVILAGGCGQRLWPWSRKDRPKPCLPLLNDSSLLEQTIQRASQLTSNEKIHLVAGPDLREWAGPCQFIEESVERNTAPAIVTAVTSITERDPEAMILVFPADHHVEYPDRYLQVLKETIDEANSAEDRIWLFGSEGPSDRGFGSIVPASIESVSPVLEFMEKPAAIDQARLDEAGALRNCGLLLFRARFLLELVAKTLQQPADSRSSEKDQIPALSLDHWLLSREQIRPHLMVSRMEPIWHDLGSWPSLRRWHPVDEQENLRFHIETSVTESIPKGSPIFIRAAASPLESDGLRRLVLLGTGPLKLVSSGHRVIVDMREDVEDSIEFSDGWIDCQQLICLVEGDILLQVISARGGLVAVSPDLVLVATEDEIGSAGLRDVLKELELLEGEGQ